MNHRKQHKLSMPGMIVLLDLVGVGLIGAGLYAHLTQPAGLVSQTWYFAQLPLLLVVLGAAMTLPLILFIVKNAGKSAQKTRGVKGLFK